MTLPTKIPMVVGILLVVFVVGTLIVGTESAFRVATTASGSIEPTNVVFANITDTTFSVSWTTELPSTGALSISGAKTTNQVLFDDQDVGGTAKKTLEKRLTHHVTFRNGSPNTDYEVTILSNSKKHLDDGKPFVVATGQVITTPSGNLEPAYGTIVNTDNRPVAGALVYLTVEGGQILSTFTKPSGTWLIPLNLARTDDLTSFLPVTERMTETILVRSDNQETNAITDTLNDAPVPDMTPGKTYDFRKLNAKAPGAPIALIPTPQTTGAPSAVLGTTTKAANIVALTIPAQGAALPTSIPLIQGTGIPGKTVSIVVGITKPIGGSAIVGADGLWSFTPPKPLAAGGQSVTITTEDKGNKPVAITHTFQILKSGTQVLGEATASATITPTATPTATLAATESATPTEESTLAAQEVPTSGYELPTIILLILAVGLMLGGGIVFLY